MERTLCGMQKKPKIFWVNIKSKGAWSPGLAAGGGAASQPCLLPPTITTQQRPNRELLYAFLLRVFWVAYGALVCLVCWLLPLRTTRRSQRAGAGALRAPSQNPALLRLFPSPIFTQSVPHLNLPSLGCCPATVYFSYVCKSVDVHVCV